MVGIGRTSLERDILVLAADPFINLKVVFVGDVASEGFEIRWIHEPNLSPLLDTYSALQRLSE